MTDSILTTTKNALGIEESNTSFDDELVMHINSVLSEFTQLGLGPDVGYAITDASQTWADFISDELRYNQAKSLLFLKVRMLFDPPSIGYVLTALEKVIEKAEWRVNIAREEVVYPPVVETDDDLEDEDIF